MLERWITALHTEDAGLEEPAATRERFKERFPKNATRRMTQLGLLVGASLEPLGPTENDTLVYASGYAETRALEGYLDSFPGASPTLFQTSIHPSAVQQALIIRQQAVRQFFPMTGSEFLPAQALQVALLAETPRTILCGGDERGTWLLENHAASERTFAFALALSVSPENALARVTLDLDSEADRDASAQEVRLPLLAFFDLVHTRTPFAGLIAPGRRLTLDWL
ncbi:beta-ketoacyl synthase chain length factor [Rariglobus hedericola]|uniref:Beta-ketoacyl synthase chain length factor n=1 Tax=Rariglobus hedericola TaxID=2597822 RepID=A0A556QN78_9BACT|nr:beta-ketoacyl synthase chain length factor [Rariglobus hedericola]TSJ78108.1 beta-ketoacyl synthase chain length factor [Rariglobus hedericola]